MHLISAKTAATAASAGTGAKALVDAIGEYGIATVLNGTTSILVGTFPGKDGSQVQLTFAEDPVAASKCWYSWDGSDALTIHVDADPTADIDIAWNLKKAA